MMWTLAAFAAVVVALSGCTHASPSSPSVEHRRACRQDLDAAMGLVERNYPGYEDRVLRFGEALHQARKKAHQSVALVENPTECDTLISAWIVSLREGHLNLSVPPERRREKQDVSGREEPFLEFSVFPRATLLTVPSFDMGQREEIEQLLNQHEDVINGRALLVLDLRGNGGGADAAYASLMPLLYTDPIQLIGVDVLATPENTEAWARLIPTIPASAADVREKLEDIVDSMRNASGFLSLGEDEVVTFPEVQTHPAQVAVIVDAGCQSTCEQFVLAARQCTKVRLIGTHTGGVLDYANVREFPLPSSQGRVLRIPTTRSRRWATNPVDPDGIAPDVVIEKKILDNLHGAALVGLAEEEFVKRREPPARR